MILFTLINRVIDLGDEIVTSRNLGVPGTYRDISNLLARGNIIDKEIASDLSNLVYQRNILAYEYYNQTEKDVFRTYYRVYVIRKFVERVKENITDV
ncbi:MAG: HepT-like ribonuclease domain-containing protein [Euryarchaeota archaeon]|nr:HepT-like ribonuclease domain-containing protein [Euryarchaeota archaeon]